MDTMTNAELISMAKGLGITLSPRWNKAKLIEEIEKIQSSGQVNEVKGTDIIPESQSNQSKKRIRNISGRRWSVFNKVLMPGEEYELSESELMTQTGMARVNRAITMNKLEWC